MLQLSRQILRIESPQKLCSRAMGKMDQFKWKRPTDKPNRKPKLSVILIEQHEKLGNAGQMVDVERGHARNFLVPKGIAAYATRENIRKYLREDTSADTSSESQVCPTFMEFLKKTNLKIRRKENEFFEVNEHQLALEYKRQYQLHVPVHCITVEEPIRSFGQFEVKVAVKDGVVVPMKVTVDQRKPKDVNFEDNRRQLQT